MTRASKHPVLAGVFVGGASRRMGGEPKGLLRAPDGTATLVERLAAVALEAGARDVVLVGQRSEYADTGLPSLADDPRGVGPIGGLGALLTHALEGGAIALALACDLPYVDAALVRRVIAHAPEAAAVAPKQGVYWQPLVARYEPAATLAAVRAVLGRGERSLRAVLGELGDRAVVLPTEAGDASLLRDWDAPSDCDA